MAPVAALKVCRRTGFRRTCWLLGVFVPIIEALTEWQWGDNSPPQKVSVENVTIFASPTKVTSRSLKRSLSFRAINMGGEAHAFGVGLNTIEEKNFIWAKALAQVIFML